MTKTNHFSAYSCENNCKTKCENSERNKTPMGNEDFRKSVLGYYGSETSCAVCARDFDLQACHIVEHKYCKCSCKANGILFCTNHHSAFDKAYFSFSSTGEVIIRYDFCHLKLQITKENLTPNVKSKVDSFAMELHYKWFEKQQTKIQKKLSKLQK